MAIPETSLRWWDPSSFWYGLRTLYDPVRIPFFRKAISGRFQHRPHLLDLGAGAGFVASGLAEIADVTVVDSAIEALSQAPKAHMAVVADASMLPWPDRSVDGVIASELLEHVDDPGLVVAEAARVTRPGGLFLYSTPARTLLSRLVLVEAAQEWSVTRVLPADLHDWDAFLTASEMTHLLRSSEFGDVDMAGIGIRMKSLPTALWALASLKAGRIGFRQAGQQIELSLTKSTRFAMIGTATRNS